MQSKIFMLVAFLVISSTQQTIAGNTSSTLSIDDEINETGIIHKAELFDEACEEKSIKKLTDLLTENYEKILEAYHKPEGIEQFKNTQTTWMKYAEAQCQFEKIGLKTDSSITLPTSPEHQCQAHVLCQRIQELQDIRNWLK